MVGRAETGLAGAAEDRRVCIGDRPLKRVAFYRGRLGLILRD